MKLSKKKTIGLIAGALALCLAIIVIPMAYNKATNKGVIMDQAALRAEDDVPDGVVYIDDAYNQTPSAGEISDDQLSAMIQSAYSEVNRVRQENGLSTLSTSAGLEQCAAVRAEEATRNWSHTRPDGSAWYTVNSNLMWGENLAYGYSDAGSAVTAWMNSPSHRENLLSSEYSTIGIRVYVTNGTYYWAQEFGH